MPNVWRIYNMIPITNRFKIVKRDYFTYKGRTVGPIFIYILNQFYHLLSHCFLNFRWLIFCFVVCFYCSFILINCIGFPSRRLSCLCEWLARQIVKSKSKSLLWLQKELFWSQSLDRIFGSQRSPRNSNVCPSKRAPKRALKRALKIN